MRVLITGAAGFLGSHLTERFLKDGHTVVGVDNFVTGSSVNIVHINSDKFIFMEKDVTEPFYVDGEFDGILHFASPASPVDFDRIPLKILDVNSVGTRNCLDLSVIKKARFFMASTSEVYGDPLIHPQREDYYGNVNPCGIRAVYDEAKRFAEATIFAYQRIYDLDVRVVRIFNTYGPRMRPFDGRVVPTFVRQALKGEPLTVFGDGSQTRSFCYVSDLVEGIYRLFNSDCSTPVNIGNPDEYTMLDFVEILKELTGNDLKVNFMVLPENDPKKRKPDITKAKELLDWKPQVSFREGLSKTIEWFKQNMEVNS